MPGDVLSTQPKAPELKPGEPLVIIPGDLDQQRGYRITKWRTYQNYECIYCQYATLWLVKMEKHQAEGEHPWAYPGQNPKQQGVVIDYEDPNYD